jgi:hypothetical protein
VHEFAGSALPGSWPLVDGQAVGGYVPGEQHPLGVPPVTGHVPAVPGDDLVKALALLGDLY